MKIYGASDDLLVIEDSEYADEINCYDETVRLLVGDAAGGLVGAGKN
jgi:hypothetical protein